MRLPSIRTYVCPSCLIAPGKYIGPNCTKFGSYIPYMVEILILVQIMKYFHTFPQKVSKCISQSESRDLTLQLALILLINRDYT